MQRILTDAHWDDKAGRPEWVSTLDTPLQAVIEDYARAHGIPTPSLLPHDGEDVLLDSEARPITFYIPRAQFDYRDPDPALVARLIRASEEHGPQGNPPDALAAQREAWARWRRELPEPAGDRPYGHIDHKIEAILATPENERGHLDRVILGRAEARARRDRSTEL